MAITSITQTGAISNCVATVTLTLSVPDTLRTANARYNGVGLIVERVKGSAGSIVQMGATGSGMPIYMDPLGSNYCDYTVPNVTDLYGGMCKISDASKVGHELLYDDGVTVCPFVYYVDASTPASLSLIIEDPICSTGTTSIQHDYRIRLVDLTTAAFLSVEGGYTGYTPVEAFMLDVDDRWANAYGTLAVSNDYALALTSVPTNCGGYGITISTDPTTIHYGDTVTFTATPVNLQSVTSYSWSVDYGGQFVGSYSYTYTGGTSSASSSPKVIYSSTEGSPATKLATVQLTATGIDNDGNSVTITSTTSFSVSYADPCVISATATPAPSSGTAPLTVAFTASASATGDCVTGDLAYAWDFGDPASGVLNNDSGASVSHVYSSSSTYTYTLTVTKANNPGVQRVVSGQVVVGLPCSISLSPTVPASTAVNQATPFTVSASFTGGCSGTTTYQWNINGTIYNIQSPTHVFSTIANNVPWSVSVTRSGVTSTASGTINVVPLNVSFSSLVFMYENLDL